MALPAASHRGAAPNPQLDWAGLGRTGHDGGDSSKHPLQPSSLCLSSPLPSPHCQLHIQGPGWGWESQALSAFHSHMAS